MHVVSFDTATKSLAISIIEYNLNYLAEIKIGYELWIKYKDFILDPNTEIYIPKDPEYKDYTRETMVAELLLERYTHLLTTIKTILDNKIKIRYVNVVDLIPDKKVSETDIVYRTEMLYNFLNNVLDPEIQRHCYNAQTVFLLEYQMGPNVKSNAISTQIMYHLTKYCEAPSKNTMQLGEPSMVGNKIKLGAPIIFGNNIQLIGPSLKNKVYIGGEDAKHSKFIEKYTTNYAANKNHTKYNLMRLLEYLNQQDIIKNIKKKNIDDIADSIIMSLAYILKHLKE